MCVRAGRAVPGTVVSSSVDSVTLREPNVEHDVTYTRDDWVFGHGFPVGPAPPRPGAAPGTGGGPVVTEMDQADRWTVADVAGHLGVAPATVRAYLARGQMPAPDGRLGRTPWWAPDTIRSDLAQDLDLGKTDTLPHVAGGWDVRRRPRCVGYLAPA